MPKGSPAKKDRDIVQLQQSPQEKEAEKIQTVYETGTLFVYGVLQNNDVVRSLLNYLPDKSMALVLSADVYGPYTVKDQDTPALSTVEIPYETPRTDDHIILGQVFRGLSTRDLQILTYLEDDEFCVKLIEVELITLGEKMWTICYVMKGETAPARLVGRKWDYDLDFAARPLAVQEYFKRAAEHTRIELEQTYDVVRDFTEEEIREAVRYIQYKKETNKNYMGQAFVDRTPTTVHYDDF